MSDQETIDRIRPLAAVAISAARLAEHCAYLDEFIKRLSALAGRDAAAFERLIDPDDLTEIAATYDELVKIAEPISQSVRAIKLPVLPPGEN